MRPWLQNVEHVVDILIIPALFVILGVVTIELFFEDVAHTYDAWLNLVDFLVIVVFAVDLGFKYRRARTREGFVKKYWLEIVAVIPFFWVFRLVELVAVARGLELGQETLHAGVEAARVGEATKSSRFTGLFRSARIGRASRFTRFLRVVTRSPRFAKAAEFFHTPDDTG